jgi:hypothetical protein
MVAPLSTPPQFAGPPSILGSELQRVYRPYITALYLDHAYKFFAPNPGPSHLLRYDLYFADGRKSINADDQLFPDRRRHWPRLWYHRHFMVTEFLGPRPPKLWRDEDRAQQTMTAGQGPRTPESLPPLASPPSSLGPVASLSPMGPLAPTAFAPIGPTPPPAAGEVLPVPTADEGPMAVDVYLQGIASYLARKHGAERVDLFYRIHRLPTPQEVHDGKPLDAADTYLERRVLTYTAGAKS